ncbi:protein TsetseEP-like isoform X2 [Acanthaster planci]|uniref:Protein TsetseEP-like isoform X2 n=1 Tax=Acanthaster planci TaxID=133434 RepID=A0A8B7YCZ3_ACAPL|nr:protein TsetseEP-like isoform X2 [Acanthaster planci]
MGCSGSTQTKQQSPQQQPNNAPQKAVQEPAVVPHKQTEEGVNGATLPPTDNKHIEDQTTVPPKDQEAEKEEEKKDEEKPTEDSQPEPVDTRTEEEPAPAEPEPEPAPAQEEAKEGTQGDQAAEQDEVAPEAVATVEGGEDPQPAQTCGENGELVHETVVESVQPEDRALEDPQNSDHSQTEQLTNTQDTADGAHKKDDDSGEAVTEGQERVTDPAAEPPTEEGGDMGRQSVTDSKTDPATEEA